jgi:uncharacterized protein YndB with AHSA1/START domain
LKSQIITTTPDSEIVSTRIVNATRDIVFKAWTDPNHLKTWWGPAGFTNTFHEFDLRPGGRWIYTMHGPEKGNYQNDVEFLVIDPPSFIAWKRHSKPLFQVVATFDEVAADQTKVVFKMLFDTAEECAKLRPFVVDKNEENLDRLEAELTRMAL